METIKDIPVLSFAGADEWESWLADNFELESGIWLRTAKKNAGIATISYQDALDVALCYGWIDGQSKTQDERFYLRKFTPRRRKSLWSKVNIGRTEILIAAGRMREAGFAAIEAAKADGRWDAAYDSPKNAVVPEDLAAILKAEPVMKAFFESLNGANRYAVLWRLMTATTPEKRKVRLEKIAAKLRAGETFH